MRDQGYETYPGVSNSYLSGIYRQMYWLPRELQVQGNVFLFGQLFHSAVLEPVYFDTGIERMEEEIDEEWLDRIYDMREAVWQCVDFMNDLDWPRAKIEAPRFGEFHGHRAKGICDLRIGVKRIWDLKTTSCSNEDNFRKLIETYGYHRQAYFYCILNQCRDFYILAVKKTSPHRLYLVDLWGEYPELKVKAQNEFRKILRYYNQLPESKTTKL